MTYLLVFLAMIVLDFVWADYIALTADRKATKASVSAVFIAVMSGFVTKGYVDEGWLMLVPVGAGAFVGTYVSIRFRR